MFFKTVSYARKQVGNKSSSAYSKIFSPPQRLKEAKFLDTKLNASSDGGKFNVLPVGIHRADVVQSGVGNTSRDV